MVNIDIEQMATAVQSFVRSRAIKLGSAIIYQDKHQIVREDPRTGQKTVIHSKK